jgi:hypothetical protein
MAFGRKVDVPGGRRRFPREPVLLVGAAVTLDRCHSVTLDDVCSTGARLSGRDLPGDGRDVLIRVGELELMASVAWSKRNACGITFENGLESSAVERLKHEGALTRVLGFD